MKNLLDKWRVLLDEGYTGIAGGVSLPAGKPSSPCPQDHEQNGMDEFGEPICRPKPRIKEKKKLFKKAKIVPYNFDWGLLGEEEKIIIRKRKDAIIFINDNPQLDIYLDNPKGTTKKFGGDTNIKLPFDYGELPDIINPADGMGWDIVISPSSGKDDENLKVVGYVAYNEKKPKALGNDKIILANDYYYSPEDRIEIENVFSMMDYFDPVVWF